MIGYAHQQLQSFYKKIRTPTFMLPILISLQGLISINLIAQPQYGFSMTWLLSITSSSFALYHYLHNPEKNISTDHALSTELTQLKNLKHQRPRSREKILELSNQIHIRRLVALYSKKLDLAPPLVTFYHSPYYNGRASAQRNHIEFTKGLLKIRGKAIQGIVAHEMGHLTQNPYINTLHTAIYVANQISLLALFFLRGDINLKIICLMASSYLLLHESQRQEETRADLISVDITKSAIQACYLKKYDLFGKAQTLEEYPSYLQQYKHWLRAGYAKNEGVPALLGRAIYTHPSCLERQETIKAYHKQITQLR